MNSLPPIDTWLIDLDHTIYDADKGVIARMSRLMAIFISDLLHIPMEEADVLRKDYWEKYGSTLHGLMTEHKVDPRAFLEYTHDFDISDVASCPTLRESLERLPGKKIIFTTAPRAFAERMTKHLGIEHCFDHIFTIEDSFYVPKPYPEPYLTIIEKFRFDPRRACMIDDKEENLKEADRLGMTTVWITGKDKDHARQNLPHVHHRAETLADWLQSVI
ncbi:MAG: pyrimidine 5'-nucleotidase [Pseudomonadota bacterium]